MSSLQDARHLSGVVEFTANLRVRAVRFRRKASLIPVVIPELKAGNNLKFPKFLVSKICEVSRNETASIEPVSLARGNSSVS